MVKAKKKNRIQLENAIFETHLANWRLIIAPYNLQQPSFFPFAAAITWPSDFGFKVDQLIDYKS
jgi:hypothetical protein